MSSTPVAMKTAFEHRRRRVKLHRRDQVLFVTADAPELQARLDLLEIELIGVVRAKDPGLDAYLEWYADEARKYGQFIRPGLAALYWFWSRPRPDGSVPLDEETYEEWRDQLAASLPGERLDGQEVGGRTIIQEFIWWSAGSWLFADHLLLSIIEFRAYAAAGRMADWKRRKRRRLAAAARKATREARAALAAIEAVERDQPAAA